MRFSASMLILCSFGLCSLATFAETPAAGVNVGPKPVITEPIDESRLVTLTGNTTAAVFEASNDRGPVADSLTFDHLLLTLKPAPETEARFERLIDEMHRQNSPEFHRWLTPQQVGERFGLAQQDRETIQRWLESHGFSINRVYQNGLVIDFAGTSAQIREAFHTEIHNLTYRMAKNTSRTCAIRRSPPHSRQPSKALPRCTTSIPSRMRFGWVM